jgi:hypothetical protein
VKVGIEEGKMKLLAKERLAVETQVGITVEMDKGIEEVGLDEGI